MREFVCTKCLEEVINETSISKEDSLARQQKDALFFNSRPVDGVIEKMK